MRNLIPPVRACCKLPRQAGEISLRIPGNDNTHSNSSNFSLKPVTFRYKQEIDPGRRGQFGLVAEDVEKEIKALKAELKEQASQIQKVSAQLHLRKPEPQTVLNNP